MEGKLRGREKESFVLSLVWLVAFFFLFCFFSPPDLGGDWVTGRLSASCWFLVGWTIIDGCRRISLQWSVCSTSRTLEMHHRVVHVCELHCLNANDYYDETWCVPVQT